MASNEPSVPPHLRDKLRLLSTFEPDDPIVEAVFALLERHAAQLEAAQLRHLAVPRPRRPRRLEMIASLVLMSPQVLYSLFVA